MKLSKKALTLVKKNGSLVSNKSKILKNWDYKKNLIKPDLVTEKSRHNYWWICSKRKHSYKNVPDQVFKKWNLTQGCKKCYDIDRPEIVRKFYLKNNLTLDKGDPYLAKQFDIKKNNRKPSEINCQSGLNAWWKCSNGHSFQQTVSKRFLRGDGCTECGHFGVSRIQIIIFYELKTLFKDVIDHKKINNYRIDFFIPSLNLVIEYDGKRYHEPKKDKKKNLAIKKRGFNLIRIREKGLKKTTKLDIFHYPNKSNKQLMDGLLNQILALSPYKKINNKIKNYLKFDNTQNNKKWREEIAKFPKPPKEKSLPYLFPKIADMWDFEKNYPLKPDNYLATSRFKPWWKCLKCGYSFKATIESKTKQKNKFVETGGCKKCYEPLKAEAVRLSKLKNRGSIVKTHPKIAKEWDHKKNKSKPEDFSMGSKSKVWWICPKGHDSYELMINKRTRPKPQGCPFCGVSKKGYAYRKFLIIAKGSIVETHPQIAKEWDYNKNKTKPNEYTYGSNFVVWWKCKNNHKSFKSKIKYRTKKRYPKVCELC
jgi:hypothetical protein